MKIDTVGIFEIRQCDGHGKAGKAVKKTSTIQIRELGPIYGSYIRKEIRFTVGDEDSRIRAIVKAKALAGTLKPLMSLKSVDKKL